MGKILNGEAEILGSGPNCHQPAPWSCKSLSACQDWIIDPKDSSAVRVLWFLVLSKGNAGIPYSLGEFGAFVFCPISVFTLLLWCFLSETSPFGPVLLPFLWRYFRRSLSGSKTVNMPLKRAKRLLCTYYWRLLSDKQVTSVHGIPPPAPLRALLGCVALSQQIKTLPLEKVSYLMKQGA